MKYSVNIRMKNPGPAKFLIASEETNDYMDAFYAAQRAADECDENHFVEIVDNEKKEVIQTFNFVVAVA